jgi:hypothetical protein
VLFQRMLANKHRAARIVVIDPRRTDTAGDADLFLGLKPGTDTALFSGLLVHLTDNGVLDRDYIEGYTSGFDGCDYAGAQHGGQRRATALATGLSEQDVATFFQMFVNTPRVVTVFARRQPVGAGHRQGQCHPQLPPRDRPHRQAGRIAVFADRSNPTRWAAARSAGSPTSLPRIWVSRRRTSTAFDGSGRRRASPPMRD